MAISNPRRVAVLLNPTSGPKRESIGAADVRAAFHAFSIDPEILILSDASEASRQIRERVKDGVQSVAAAGGDGTVAIVGAALAGTSAAMGVIPAGTFNHFARDMRVPVDLDAAVAVIAGGHTTCVDVGEVNGRVFVNNSSLGFYPTLVAERERRTKKGMSKAIALAPAVITAIWRFPNLAVRLLTNEKGLVTRTPFVFIGNNQYVFSGLQAGSRARLCDGRLQLCAISGTSRWTLLKSFMLALAGRLDTAPEVITLDTTWARIVTLRRHVRVALDGEVVRLRSPLVYTIRPGALRVFVPPDGSDQ